MAYVLIPDWLEGLQAILIVIEIFAWIYIMFLRDWIQRNITKKTMIRHGTYIDVSFWDVGIKTGNMPGFSIDSAINGINGWVSEKLSPNTKDELIKTLSRTFNKGDIESILSYINQKEGKKKKD